MKAKILFLVLFIITLQIGFTQIPSNYYSNAENNADDDLKYALNQIIDNHTEFPYTSSSIDTWDILKVTDMDENNQDNVILIYSGISVNGAQEYNSANGWTREHVWAKSRGDFGTALGPGTDVHALRPLDNSTNSSRSNRGFDNCIDCSDVFDKWSNNTGSKKDDTVWSFEPRDEVKGDVARMIFYMAVRYEGYDSYPDLEVSETILGISDKSPLHGVLSTLLEWHRNDPVDGWEEKRNDIIYYDYQNNRNPFIDYPEIAEHLWGNMVGLEWNSSLFVNEFSKPELKLYPNPASNFVRLTGVLNDSFVHLYDVLGMELLSEKTDFNNYYIDISQLKKGMYFLKVSDNNKILTFKFVKK